jgi:hypothetical protein
MCKEPTIAVSRALDTARACRGVIHDDVRHGPLPAKAAGTLARSAEDAAVQLEGVLTDFGHKLIPELALLIEQGAVAMRTVSELGGVIALGTPGCGNAQSLTRAVGYAAEKALSVLARAEHCLMVAAPG